MRAGHHMTTSTSRSRSRPATTRFAPRSSTPSCRRSCPRSRTSPATWTSSGPTCARRCVVPGAPQGGMTPDQQEQAKALAFDSAACIHRWRLRRRAARPMPPSAASPTGSPAPARPTNRRASSSKSCSRPATTRGRPAWRKDPGRRLLRRNRRRRHVGHPRRDPPQAGRRAVRRSSRRTATSAARGSRTRTPAPASTSPNAFYSYSFAQKIDWPKYFSPQEVLLDYFRDVRRRATASASTSASAPRSSSAACDDERAGWRMQLRGADGARRRSKPTR